MLNGKDNLISYNETFLDSNMVVLGAQITPIRFGSEELTSVIAGFTAHSIGQHLFLRSEDGQRAVELFAQSEINYYDLILMDIQMPRMDGFEATEKIRAMNRHDAATVPIFAMTANAFAEDEEKSRKAGMNAHISKPLEISALLEAMNETLNRG